MALAKYAEENYEKMERRINEKGRYLSTVYNTVQTYIETTTYCRKPIHVPQGRMIKITRYVLEGIPREY